MSKGFYYNGQAVRPIGVGFGVPRSQSSNAITTGRQNLIKDSSMEQSKSTSKTTDDLKNGTDPAADESVWGDDDDMDQLLFRATQVIFRKSAVIQICK